jgi:hypothetical protein
MKKAAIPLVGLTGLSTVFAATQESAESRVMPEVLAAQAIHAPCYVITSEGRAFDLSSMCGVSRPERLGTPSGQRLSSIQPQRQSWRRQQVARTGIAHPTTQRWRTPSAWGYLPSSAPSSRVTSGQAPKPTPAIAATSLTTSFSGTCNYPDQVAADGTRCQTSHNNRYYAETAVSPNSLASSFSGVCHYPDQVAADGKLCGSRASIRSKDAVF